MTFWKVCTCALSSTMPLCQEDTPHIKQDCSTILSCLIEWSCNVVVCPWNATHVIHMVYICILRHRIKDKYRTPEMLKGRDIHPRVLNIDSSACEHKERMSDDVRFLHCGNCKLLEKIDTRNYEGFNLHPRGICRQGVERLNSHSMESFECLFHFATNMSKFLVFRKSGLPPGS